MIIVLTDKTEKLFNDCVAVNGITSQTRQYYEELGEVTVALAKWQRAQEWGTPEEVEQKRKELLSEIADNIIMGCQFAQILGLDEVTEFIKSKLERQQTRIDKAKQQHG